MKYVRLIIAPCLMALLLGSGCATNVLTPQRARKNLVGLWKMDMTERRAEHIANYEKKKETQPPVVERPKMDLNRPAPRARFQEEPAPKPSRTDEEMLEMLLSQEEWYEFKADGSLILTATMMEEKQTREHQWEFAEVVDNKLLILIREASYSLPIEIEFINDDKICFRVIPPDDADEEEVAEYEKAIVIFERDEGDFAMQE